MLRFNQIKKGMYIYHADMNIFCKVIETRLLKRRGSRSRHTIYGHTRSGYKKLIFGRWSRSCLKALHNRKIGLQCMKMHYGCPFKKLSREYECRHATGPVRYFCLEAPIYAKDLETVPMLKGMIKVGE